MTDKKPHTAQTPAVKVTPRKRGRPPKISRKDILLTALELLSNGPAESLSMAKIARALDTGPMTLYNHVENKGDLLEGVAQLALQQLEMEIPTGDSWQEQLNYWMRAVRQHFIRFPQLIKVLGWENHISSSWLSVMGDGVDILYRAGLREKILADTSQWLGHTLVSSLTMELNAHMKNGPPQVDEENLAMLSDLHSGHFEKIKPLLANSDAEFIFNFSVNRVIDGVERLVSQAKV